MSQKRFSGRIFLAGLFLALMTPFAGAQGMSSLGGGGASSGGLNSTGGAGGSSAGGNTGGVGTSQSIGSGNLSALKNGGTGLSSLSSNTTTGGGNGSTSTIPAAADPFSSFYIDPYSTGIIGTTNNSSNTFGQPIYPITATATTNATAITTVKAGAAIGYTSVGTRRAPAYVTAAGEDLPLVRHNLVKLQNECQQTLAQSSSLKSKQTIRVEILEGAIARLSGTVQSAHEKRLAEGLIRLTPGIQNVQNNLQVQLFAQAP